MQVLTAGGDLYYFTIWKMKSHVRRTARGNAEEDMFETRRGVRWEQVFTSVSKTISPSWRLYCLSSSVILGTKPQDEFLARAICIQTNASTLFVMKF